MTTIGQGLLLAGQMLGQGLTRRQRNKRMTELAQALMPNVAPEELPGYQGGMGEAASMLGSTMPGSPLPNLAPAAMVQTAANQQAGKINADRETIRAMLMSGDPRAEQMAMQIAGAKFAPKENKATSVSGGYVDEEGVFHRTEAPPNLKIQQYGKNVFGIDPQTGEHSKLFEVDPEKEYQFDTYVDMPASKKAGYEVKKVKYREKNSDSPAWEYTDEVADTSFSVNADKPGMGMTPRTRGTAEGELFKVRMARQRVEDLVKPWDPKNPTAGGFRDEWLTWEGRGIQFGKGVVDKSQILKWVQEKVMTEEEGEKFWQEHQAYQKWGGKVRRNINRLIKEITGAQMSEKEVPRLMGEMPNLQDGVHGFMGKHEAVMEYLDDVEAEVQDIMTRGLIPSGIRPAELYGENVTYSGIYDKAIEAGMSERDAMEKAARAWAADKITYDSQGDAFLEGYGGGGMGGGETVGW